MKKKISILLILLSLFISGVVVASSINGDYQGKPIVKLLVNGSEVHSEIPAYIDGGSTFLPLRSVSEALGGNVTWNPNDYSVTITNEIPFNYVDGEPLYFVTDGPLHFLHKSVDPFSVVMTNKDKTATYKKDIDYTVQNGITRLNSGSIKKEETVLVSYGYVDNQPKKDYNTNAVKNTLAKLKRHNPVTIVFLGDSTTEQNYQTQGFDNHVKQVEAQLKAQYPRNEIEVINKGISGNNTTDGLQRFKKDVLDLNPDLVIICFGINDADKNFKKIDTSLFKSNMDTMIKTLVDQGKEVIVRTPNTLNTEDRFQGYKEYIDITRKLADQYKVGLSDIYNKFDDLIKQGLTNQPDLTTDGVHPNARAQTLITDELMKFFK